MASGCSVASTVPGSSRSSSESGHSSCSRPGRGSVTSPLVRWNGSLAGSSSAGGRLSCGRRPLSLAPDRRVTDNNRDICFVPAVELVRLYRARKTSPLEVMQAVLARIDAVNPAVNAYVTVARESALAEARRATRALGRRGTPLPSLYGVPVSIKDLTATKGIRTTWGSQIYQDHVPDKDDLVVERLKAAGAIVVGKTNTPEFGAGGHTFK